MDLDPVQSQPNLFGPNLSDQPQSQRIHSHPCKLLVVGKSLMENVNFWLN